MPVLTEHTDQMDPNGINIKEEDFPVYTCFMSTDNPGFQKGFIKELFENAVKGEDEDKSSFALTMQQIARDVPTNELNECTEDAKDKTFISCLEVFTALDKRAEPKSKEKEGTSYMVAYLSELIEHRKVQRQP